MPAGRLGDVRGRRSIFVVGVGLFTLASAACGAAQSSTWLVIARLIQGLAGGMVTPQISATIQQLFSGKERGKAFGIFGSVVGLSTAIGPLVGGLLIQAFGQSDGWRWVFFVNLPIGLVVIPIAWRLLPGAGDATKRRHDFDPIGVLLLGIGVVVLLLPFVQDQTWKGELKWLLVPAALILLAIFVVWELAYGRRDKEAVVELSLFKLRSYLVRRLDDQSVFRRVHPALLRPDALPADRPQVFGTARGTGHGAVRDRQRYLGRRSAAGSSTGSDVRWWRSASAWSASESWARSSRCTKRRRTGRAGIPPRHCCSPESAAAW